MTSWLDLEGEPTQEYTERYHEDPDAYNPERFENEIAGMDNEELLELYSDWFGTEPALEGVDN